mgnify:CR=1 FL=1
MDYDELYLQRCEFQEMLQLAEDRYIYRSMKPFTEGQYVERFPTAQADPVGEVPEIEPEQARVGSVHRRKRRKTKHLPREEDQPVVGNTGYGDRIQTSAGFG